MRAISGPRRRSRARTFPMPISLPPSPTPILTGLGPPRPRRQRSPAEEQLVDGPVPRRDRRAPCVEIVTCGPAPGALDGDQVRGPLAPKQVGAGAVAVWVDDDVRAMVQCGLGRLHDWCAHR